MEIRLGGGRTISVTLGDNDRMNVDGVTYSTGTSLTLYEGHGHCGGDNEITIFFPSRGRMKEFAEKIVREINEATGE